LLLNYQDEIITFLCYNISGDKMILLLIILVIFLIIYIILKRKLEKFLLKYFHTKSLSEVIEKTEFEAENTPKTVSGMESVYSDIISKDFPELNLNELKSMVEKSVLDCLQTIESGNINDLSCDSSKAMSFVKSRIEDYKDKKVKFDQIKFHKTVLDHYQNKNGIATMYFQTSLEYYLSFNGKRKKKVQDRYKVDFIYIIDSKKVHKKVKSLGLNCPNCGAPITDVGVKVCKYCGSGDIEIVKRVWIFNNIENY